MELLNEHHQHIHPLLGEAEAALGSIDPSRARTLALTRWQLLRCLRSYQLFKHSELFAPFIRGKDPEKARSAEAMKARCITISESYNEHVGKWAATGVESDWSAYQADATSVVSSIRNHLARELTETGQLLLPTDPRTSPNKGVSL